MLYVDLIFLLVGLCFSVFYGFWCMEIWNPEMKEKLKEMQLFHQRWFNFFCSVVGWIILFLLYKSVASFPLSEIVSRLYWQHVILIIIASLGVTGHLPSTLWSLSRAPRELSEYLKGVKGM